MKNRQYEWAFEHKRPGDEDIEESMFTDTLVDVPTYYYDPAESEFGEIALALVLDIHRGDSFTQRAWAYVQPDGTLERYFHDAFGEKVLEVPQRFHKQLRGFQRRTSPVFQVVTDFLGSIKLGDVIKLDGQERAITKVSEDSRFKIVRAHGSRKIDQLPKSMKAKFKRRMPYSGQTA